MRASWEDVTMPPDWTLLVGLDPGDLQTAMLAEADAVMNGQPGPEQDRLLPALPEPLRAMLPHHDSPSTPRPP